MADERFTLETTIRVFDNRHGTYFEVAPDDDGLDLIRLKYCEPGVDPNSFPSLTFDPAQVPAIVEALQRVARSIGDSYD